MAFSARWNKGAQVREHRLFSALIARVASSSNNKIIQSEKPNTKGQSSVTWKAKTGVTRVPAGCAPNNLRHRCTIFRYTAADATEALGQSIGERKTLRNRDGDAHNRTMVLRLENAIATLH